MPDKFLDAAVLQQLLGDGYVEVHEEIGSTNDRAVQLAHDQQLPLPALVVARHQTAGRGRGVHRWWAAEGALTFSWLIEPAAYDITVANWPKLSLATAVGICDALAMFWDEPTPAAKLASSHSLDGLATLPKRLGIKWPNDVYLLGRKIAGILLESPAGARGRLIIGVGININNSFAQAPPGIRKSAISLSDATGIQHDLQAVLPAVVAAMSARFTQLGTGQPEPAIAWQTLDLLAGQKIVVTEADRRIEGKCVGLDRDAAIVLESAHGLQRLFSGSIELIG